MKKLSEIYAPRSKDEKAFVALHTVKKSDKRMFKDKAEDDRYTGGNIKTVNRAASRLGRDTAASEKAYGVSDKHPGQNDQLPVDAVAPYTFKNEAEIEEANLINKKKKNEYIKKLGKAKSARPNPTACAKAGRAELRKEDDDIQLDDEMVDLLLGMIDDYFLKDEQ